MVNIHYYFSKKKTFYSRKRGTRTKGADPDWRRKYALQSKNLLPTTPRPLPYELLATFQKGCKQFGSVTCQVEKRSEATYICPVNIIHSLYYATFGTRFVVFMFAHMSFNFLYCY
jgi:hypothetical protein